VNWKEQLRDLKDLSSQDNKPNKWTPQPTDSFAKTSSRVDYVAVKFIQSVDWLITTDAWGYKRPTVFKVHPKPNSDKPWEHLDSQIIIKIDYDSGQIEIEPPSVLSKRNSQCSILIPLSDFNEEKIAFHLKEIYIQLREGVSDEGSSASLADYEESTDTFRLGWYYSDNKDEFQMAKMAEKDRLTHLYVIGATGTGKTKFLEFLIQQDIEKGNGFGVIDPHGDLIEDTKGFLACYHRHSRRDEIFNRVVLIDPTDTNFTVTFNPLEKLPNVSVAEQVGELISSFKKIWSDSWGVRMEDLMRNSLIALGEAECTITELPRFLTDRSFRSSVLKRVENPLAHDYFVRRFNVLTDRGQLPFIEPVLNKINAFLADPRIRQMFSSPKSSFNLREVIDHKKMLLIKLDKGKLKGSADLLGSLLMAKIQLAAFSRSDIPPSKRTPFHLYIDEFQNFASESFMVILSEARKYGLSLIMAHQTLAQISEELRSLILGNAGIQVFFRVNRKDAQVLAKEAFEYSGYEVKTFWNLHPIFWSLGEEWEHKTEELQKLPPRCCYAKHQIEGGLLPLITADIEPAWEVLGVEEDNYLEYVKTLPFGEKYLVDREKLPLTLPRAVPLIEKIEKIKEDKSIPQTLEEEIEIEIVKREPLTLPIEAIEVTIPEPKEERQHRYLQSLLKHIAQEQGYRAVIEEPTPDGGRVDVGLEQDGIRIACEISVTSTSEQEIGNIEKCLRAGYDRIVVCCPENKSLEKIKALALERFDQDEQEKLHFIKPDEFYTYLQEWSTSLDDGGDRVKGYKVKVQYQSLEEDEQLAKREAVAQVILQSLKRQKDK
jgi:hypothetical protein